MWITWEIATENSSSYFRPQESRMRLAIGNIAAGCLLASFASLSAWAATAADTSLVDAVKTKNAVLAAELIKKHADVNAAQGDGATALHWAAHWDDVDTAALLIRAGADVNAANDLGATPLSLACTNRSTAMVNKL